MFVGPLLLNTCAGAKWLKAFLSGLGMLHTEGTLMCEGSIPKACQLRLFGAALPKTVENFRGLCNGCFGKTVVSSCSLVALDASTRFDTFSKESIPMQKDEQNLLCPLENQLHKPLGLNERTSQESGFLLQASELQQLWCRCRPACKTLNSLPLRGSTFGTIMGQHIMSAGRCFGTDLSFCVGPFDNR